MVRNLSVFYHKPAFDESVKTKIVSRDKGIRSVFNSKILYGKIERINPKIFRIKKTRYPNVSNGSVYDSSQSSKSIRLMYSPTLPCVISFCCTWLSGKPANLIQKIHKIRITSSILRDMYFQSFNRGSLPNRHFCCGKTRHAAKLARPR